MVGIPMRSYLEGSLFSGFIGFAPDIYELVSHHNVEDTDDDQLYYTKLYLDKDIRVSIYVSRYNIMYVSCALR